MRVAWIAFLLVVGCAAPEEAPPSSEPTAAGPSPAPASPSSSPVPVSPSPKPAPILVENGSLPETPVAAGRTVEILFRSNATDRALVNLVFGPVQKAAPYGWSAQVSLHAPDGRVVADSGTSMPEGGAAFQLRIGGLGQAPGDLLARVTASHPTSLSARLYVDEAAGPP